MALITCPVCGRRITTTGESGLPSHCPDCGALLLDPADSRDESDTRPVPLDQIPTRPDRLESGETRDLPASALPSAPQMSQPPEQTGTRGRMRRLWRRLGIVALVALLLALVAGAALAVNGALSFGQRTLSPTATVGAITPSATPATITYQRDGLYSITYPGVWWLTENNHAPSRYSASFINPHGGASVTVTAQQTPAYVDAATVDINYLRGLTFKTGTAPAHVSKPQAVSLAGQTWTEMSADVALVTAAGTQYAHAVVMTVNHHGYVYTIVRLVPWPDKAGVAAAFAQAEQASFQPMLATLTFLG